MKSYQFKNRKIKKIEIKNEVIFHYSGCGRPDKRDDTRDEFVLILLSNKSKQTDACSSLLLSSGAFWSGAEYHLIFNLSVFELVGFQQKCILNLLIMLYHPAKVPSMFFTISLDLRSAHCALLQLYICKYFIGNNFVRLLTTLTC